MPGTPTLSESDARRVLDAINEQEVVDFLRRLIQTPTVNPPGDVREAVQLSVQPLSEAGFEVRTIALDETKPNLIARFGQGRPVLCFNAHLDVVPIGELRAWTHAPFAADVEDERIYGRGAGDDKASVAAQVMASVALARSGVALEGTLIVNEVADEEVGGPAGAAFVVNEGHVRPDFVIVGEQTLNRICVGEKGVAATRVTVYGRAAHGALPWEGANAIEGMAEVVSALRSELWPRLESRTHPLFHHSSASVNMVAGGVKENVVPDRCMIAIDRRLIPGENPDDSLAEIAEVAQCAVASMPGVSVVVEFSGERRTATMSDPASPLVQAMLAANRYLGLSEALAGFSMATDGRFFAAAGYPTIIYGPGDPTLAHVPDEWVGIDEVVQATRAYALAALTLIGQGGQRK
ncbi:MAG: M20 family metallopeptidase [Thermomicrobiales bacterium]